MTKFHNTPTGPARCQEKKGMCPYGGPIAGIVGDSGKVYETLREQWMEEKVAVERERKAFDAMRKYATFNATEEQEALEEFGADDFKLYQADKEVWTYSNGRDTNDEVNRRILYVRSFNKNRYCDMADEIARVKSRGSSRALIGIIGKYYLESKGVQEADTSPLRDDNASTRSWDNEKHEYTHPYSIEVEALSYSKHSDEPEFESKLRTLMSHNREIVDLMLSRRALFDSDTDFSNALVKIAEQRNREHDKRQQRLSLIEEGADASEVKYLDKYAPEKLDSIVRGEGRDMRGDVSVAYSQLIENQVKSRHELDNRESSNRWGRLANSIGSLYRKLVQTRAFFSDGGLNDGVRPQRGEVISNKWTYSNWMYFRVSSMDNVEQKRRRSELRAKYF